MTIDEFISNQPSGYAATIQIIPDDDTSVRVIPWTGQQCHCKAHLVVRKSDITRVAPTGDFHLCCGKRLPVVSVEFRAGASIPIEIAFQQLASIQLQASVPPPAVTRPGPGQPLATQPRRRVLDQFCVCCAQASGNRYDILCTNDGGASYYVAIANCADCAGYDQYSGSFPPHTCY